MTLNHNLAPTDISNLVNVNVICEKFYWFTNAKESQNVFLLVEMCAIYGTNPNWCVVWAIYLNFFRLQNPILVNRLMHNFLKNCIPTHDMETCIWDWYHKTKRTNVQNALCITVIRPPETRAKYVVELYIIAYTFTWIGTQSVCKCRQR